MKHTYLLSFLQVNKTMMFLSSTLRSVSKLNYSIQVGILSADDAIRSQSTFHSVHHNLQSN